MPVGLLGGNCRLRSRPGPANEPFFPFLEYHEASPGSSIHSDGSVDVCKVCQAFLIGQWNSYERNNTPIVKRLYWLKRADGSGSGGSGSRKNDPQMHVSTHVRDDMYKLNMREAQYHESEPRDDNGYQETSEPPLDKCRPGTSAVDIDVPSVAVCYGCGASTSKHSIRVVHTSHWSKSEEPYFPCILGHPAPSGAKPVDHLGRVLMCDPCTVYLLRQWHNYERDSIPLHQRKYHLRNEGDLVTEGLPSGGTPAGSGNITCFLCGQTAVLSSAHLIRANRCNANEPYYPFLEKHTPAPGALALSKDGVAQVCSVCSKDLYEQWNAHELTHNPHSKRSYRIPKIDSSSSGSNKEGSDKSSRSEVCYLCSQLTAHSSLKVVNTLAPDKTSSHHMYFPFITNVKRPHKAKPIDSDGRTLVCTHCNAQLKQQWKIFQGEGVPHNERRYVINPYGTNQRNGLPDAYAGVSPTIENQPFSNGVCFLCGAHADPTRLYKLHSYPRRSLDELHDSTPFFPFLASRNPAPSSAAIETDGTVLSCLFCYFNLIAQWHDYENSKSFADSNRWLRRYYVHEFVCYTCGQFASRDDVRTISTKEFSFLLKVERPKGGLVLDQGSVIVTCSACELSLIRQKRSFEHMRVPEEKRRYKIGKPQTTSPREVR